jgi:general secretion pathway protein K
LAAILAAATLADFGHAYDVHSGRFEQAQSRQLALGALDWARNVLAEDQRTSANDHLGEAWAIQIPPTPIDKDANTGVIGGRITDLSGRFNLNALHPAYRQHVIARVQCERLFTAVLGNPLLALQLVTAIGDYLTGKASTTTNEEITSAGRRLISLDELSHSPLFSAEVIAALAPHVSTLPEVAPINANTATAEVLVAVVEGLKLDEARILTAARERVWYRNLADFNARLGENVTPPTAAALGVRSRYFQANIHAGYGQAITRLQALLDREHTWPSIIWYRYE